MTVITFRNTTQAIMFEEIAKEENLDGRIIPLPTSIGAGCGLCWLSINLKETLLRFIENYKLEYEDIYNY